MGSQNSVQVVFSASLRCHFVTPIFFRFFFRLFFLIFGFSDFRNSTKASGFFSHGRLRLEGGGPKVLKVQFTKVPFCHPPPLHIFFNFFLFVFWIFEILLRRQSFFSR